MPLKLNMGGVIPGHFCVICAVDAAEFVFGLSGQEPGQLFYGKIFMFFQVFHAGILNYELIFLTLIMFFTFFYVSIVFNVEEVADNLRKHGGFMPGIRPGRATAEYLNTILTRLTTVGAIYLAMVAFFPQFMLSGFKWRACRSSAPSSIHLSARPPVFNGFHRHGVSVYFRRHIVTVLVGVAMDTVAQIEAQLVMRNYEGFLGGGGRLRGRRA